MQLSVAAGDKAKAAVISAVLLHCKFWLNESTGVVTIGNVSSTTVTVLVQVEIHPFASVIFNDNKNVALHPEPAVTDTDWEFLLPTITPFPEIFHS